MDSLAILPHEDQRRDPNDDIGSPLDEADKKLESNEDIQDEKVKVDETAGWTVPEEWIARFIDEYTGEHGGQSETLPPGADPEMTARAVLTYHQDEAAELLRERIEAPDYDYNFDTVFFERCKSLVQGPEACGYEYGDWAYITSKTAGYIHNWSPYAEVRAVTLPYDDPSEPCETFRAYLLGFFWVIIVTAVNTCEYPGNARCVILINSLLTQTTRYFYPWFRRPTTARTDGSGSRLHPPRLGFHTKGGPVHDQSRAVDFERATASHYHLYGKHDYR